MVNNKIDSNHFKKNGDLHMQYIIRYLKHELLRRNIVHLQLLRRNSNV